MTTPSTFCTIRVLLEILVEEGKHKVELYKAYNESTMGADALVDVYI